MQEERSRVVAKAMADVLMSMSRIKGDNVGELRVAQAAGLGFLMVAAGGKSLHHTSSLGEEGIPVYSLAFNGDGDTSILESYFHSIILKSNADPDELLNEFGSMCEQLRSQKRLNRLMRAAVKSSKPADKMGRPAKIAPANWPRFLELSQQLLPLCVALGRLHRSVKMRGWQQHLDFLELDYREQVKFLMQHLGQVDSALNDKELLAHIKTSKTRAEKLADIFAGFAFGLSPQYAMQQALVAKRTMRLARLGKSA